jgi:hypothetical protein
MIRRLVCLAFVFCGSVEAIPFELDSTLDSSSGSIHYYSMPGLDNEPDLHLVTVKFKTTGLFPKVIQEVIGGHTWVKTNSNSSLAKRGFPQVELGFNTDKMSKAFIFDNGFISDESWRSSEYDYAIVLRVDMATYRKASFYADSAKDGCYSPNSGPNCAGIWNSTRPYNVLYSNCNKYSTDVLKYAGIIPDGNFDAAVTAYGLKVDMLDYYMAHYND